MFASLLVCFLLKKDNIRIYKKTFFQHVSGVILHYGREVQCTLQLAGQWVSECDRLCAMLNKSLGLMVRFCSVQFSRSVVSDSLRPHEPQHTIPPCPSPTARVYPNPCSLSRWCHPTISSSVIHFSSCPQSFPASGSFQMSQLFVWGGQSIEISASTSVLPMNTQDWSALGWTGWLSLKSRGLSRVFSNTTVQKHQFFGTQPSL